MTMAYIVFVNPAILHETGMPLAAVTAATCLSAAVGSFLMGGLARYPIALAPGHGAERLLHLHRGEGHGRALAGGAGRGVPLRRGVLPADPAGRAPAHHLDHPARAVRGGGGGRGPVHRAHRLPQFRHHRAQPRHHRDAGQPARQEHRAGALRPGADRRAAGVARARRHADRHSGHHRRWAWPPAWPSGRRKPTA